MKAYATSIHLEETAEAPIAEHDYASNKGQSDESFASVAVFSQLQLVFPESAPPEEDAGAQQAAGRTPSQLQTSVSVGATDVPTVVAGDDSACEGVRLYEASAMHPLEPTVTSSTVSEAARESTNEYVDVPTILLSTVDQPS